MAIASYSGPFVRKARSMLDSPIVSMGRPACCWPAARRFALVTLPPENVWRLREMVKCHGMEKRVSGIYALEPRTTECDLVNAFAEPSRIVGFFESGWRGREPTAPSS